MYRNAILLSCLALFFTACSDTAQQQLTKAQTQLAEAQAALVEAQELLAAEHSANVVHLVLLNIKDDLSEEQLEALTTELRRIGTIENVHNFELGSFADVGDQRALSDYELVMKMAFTSRDEMAKYQVDATHEEVRSKLGPYLAGPPAVYDYEVGD